MVVVVVVVVEIDNMVVEIDNNDQHDGWNEDYFIGQAFFKRKQRYRKRREQTNHIIHRLSLFYRPKKARKKLSADFYAEYPSWIRTEA